MNKKMKIVIVLIFILLLISSIGIYAYSKQNSYNNTNMNVIIGSWYDEGKWRQVKYTFNRNNTVKAEYDDNTSAVKDYVLVFQGANNGNFPILNQPNVWCVQKGKDLLGAPAEMKIGKEIKVSDPMLAYILAKGTKMGQIESKYDHAAQNALWKYLTDPTVKTKIEGTTTLTDKGIILKNINCATPDSTAGDKLYKEAQDYAARIKNLNDISINDFMIEAKGDKIIINPKISGFTSFDVKINGTEFKDNNNKIEIELEQFKDDAKLTITIKINYIKYEAKYRILYSENHENQRLLVSTSITEEATSTENPLEKEIDNSYKTECSVSLEKYITKVYSAVNGYNNPVIYTDREWKRYNEQGKDESNKNLYKKDNPIQVEIGDIIEYTIKVTNTSNNSAFNLSEIIDIPGEGLECYSILTTGWNVDVGETVKITPSENRILEKGTSLYINISFKVSENAVLGENISNKAKITKNGNTDLSVDNDKDGLGNNADADYIVVYKYNVDIQKYIAKVNGNNIYDLRYDMNNDGFVDKMDSYYIGEGIADINDIPEQVQNKLDVNDDGKINSKDRTELEKKIFNGILNVREGLEDGYEGTDMQKETEMFYWFKRFNYTRYMSLRQNNTEADIRNNHPMIKEHHTSFVKFDNPVEVEVGNSTNPTKITYTIKISNPALYIIDKNINQMTQLKVAEEGNIFITEIKDKPEINTEKGVGLKSLKYIPRGIVSNYDIDVTGPNDAGEYTLKFQEPVLIENLSAIYIDVELELNYDDNYDGSSVILRNEAKVEQGAITNSQGKPVYDADGDANNEDCDFIKIQEYSVSLEKFVSKVNNTNITGRNRTVDNRAINGSYEDAKFKDKEVKAVKVETGDEVTFTIRVKNTGEAQVKVTEIKDVFTNNNDIKLIYMKQDKGSYDSEENKIKFNDDEAELLEVNGVPLEINVTYKVYVSPDKSTGIQTLDNEAEIINIGIKNRNNISVIDSDGVENNKDKDWVKTKSYRATIQKYVVGVESTEKTGKALITEESNLLYNCDKENREEYGKASNSKYNDRVKLEVGDKVTYRIKLTNTGNDSDSYGVIKNLKVTDICPEGLTYKNCLKSSKGVIIQVDSSRTEFTYKGTLGLGETDTFDIIYEVTGSVIDPIENIATLNTELKNKNDEKVKDGTSNDNIDRDWIEPKKYQASLEKYVVGVQSTGKTGTNLIKDAGPLYNCENVNRNGHAIYNEPITNNINTDNIKHKDPVNLEIGDFVIYRITLTNTGNVSDTYGVIKNLKVTDICPQGLKYDSCLNSYVRKQENQDIFTYTGSLGLNSSVTFDIKYEVIGSMTKPIENTASLDTNLTNRNNAEVTDITPDDNKDQDWIKLKKYQASLEKYVVGVQSSGKTGTNLIKDAGPLYNCDNVNRSGHTIYNEPITNNINTDNIKHKDPVNLEKGDYVIYRIKLTNTGNNTDDYGEIKDLKVEDICPQGLEYITHSNQLVGIDENLKVYTYLGSLGLNSSVTFDIKFKVIGSVTVPIENTASLDTNLTNRNNEPVIDNTPNDNSDRDWIKVKPYAVSLEKYVSTVTKADGTVNGFARSGYAEHKYDNNLDTVNDEKYNKPVEVANGDTVTYAIKVTNNHETKVKNIKVRDTLPNGLNLNTLTLKDSNGNNISFNINNNVVEFTLNNELNKNDSITVYMSAIVTEPNISLDVLKNHAEIIGTMKNRNNEDVNDSTGNDNQDADYIQMKDIIISGFVWNDKAKDKGQNHYNGQYDEEYEKNIVDGKKTIDEIKVYLYRVSGDNSNKVAETTTNNGEYIFTSKTFDESIAIKDKYIKASKVANDKNSRWSKPQYHSYYVVFEYDGVKYTSTFTQEKDRDGNVTDKIEKRIWDITENDLNNNIMYSNAQENEDDRIKFNDKFSRIDFNGAYDSKNKKIDINYDTENKNGYIPQSKYLYNSNMNMQSSTNKITLSKDANLEEQLKHINLGLRGKDVFDLELTSDVHNIKVTVNNQTGEYKYTNKAELRQSDLTNNTFTTEDMANTELELSNEYVDGTNTGSNVTDDEGQQQNIRNTDFNVDNNRYDSTQGVQNIEVTYKLTVHNASRTRGTAIEIINYYDSKYNINKDQTVKGIYYYYDSENNVKQKDIAGIKLDGGEQSGTNYNSVLITIPETMLNQAEKMDIYLVYTLKKPITTTLEGLTKDNTIPTYNMAEITEYKTACREGQTEYTRGLIDKDSAPGSVATEKVRLANPERIGEKSTLEYYFAATDLQNLKYEDDTYATPTLYFVSNSSQRTITGTVFEDLTQVNSNNVKSGNGIKDGNDPTIQGITVELYESGKVDPIDSKSTNSNGYYEFTGLLPGNYTIKYYYGDTEATFLKKNGNKASYNGENFQATNNSHDVEGIPVNKLSEESNYWYLDNEGIGVSTAFDDEDRRIIVTDNVTKFSDDEMSVLNDVRDDDKEIPNIGNKDDANSLIGRTYMYANTKPMVLNVEKTDKPEGTVTFGKYEITDMNFGIAQVPVTIIDLQKSVDSFTITDATGKNIIASASKNAEGKWKDEKQGDVKVIDGHNTIFIEIEDEKLQGARLQVKYAISANTDVQLNYDKKGGVEATIKELEDIIDNNLSYNSQLDENSKYWEEEDKTLERQSSKENINSYKTIVNANEEAIKRINEGKKIYITLEKVLSSTDSTLSVDTYEYNNTVEITDLNYDNVKPEGAEDNEEVLGQRDRIRTSIEDGGFIILPKKQHDTAIAETIAMTTPTGDSSIHTVYYILAAISLLIITVGVFGIKKFVLNNKQ